MTEAQKQLPKWILIVSGIFALLEIFVSFSLSFSPEWAADKVDLNAKGVDYLMNMWAVRQLALGVILAFATFKRSAPMLSLCYIFFLVMMIGDLVIGIFEKDNSLIIASLVMLVISSAMIFAINKRK